MYSSQDGFDPIGIIVDWFDTCRERRVAVLIDLYDDGAIVDCCQGDLPRAARGRKVWAFEVGKPGHRSF